MRATRPVFLFLSVGGTTLAATGGCGSPAAPARTAQTCGPETRPQLDCDSEIAFDNRKIEGGFAAFGVNASAKTELTALRQVDDAIQAYVVASRRICDEYNKCVLDKEQYATRSENLRRRLSRVPELYDGVKAAGTNASRASVVSDAYEALVPEEQRIGIEVELAVLARRPNEAAPRAIHPGDKLPTGSRLSFSLRPSRPAHVYLFQKTPVGETNVLFPDKRIPVSNPIAGNTELVLPPGDGTFRLNDKDIGTEKVFVVASLAPVASLDAAIQQLGAGGAESGALKSLSAIPFGNGAALQIGEPCRARALELDPSPAASASAGCVRSRGLELDGPVPAPMRGAVAKAVSLRAKSEAADTTIVKVFAFEHTR